MRFDLIRQQMQDLLVDLAGVLAHMQKLLRIRLEAGDINAAFKYFIFTLVIVVVRVLAHLEMMHLLIFTHGDRVIIHADTTITTPNCLSRIWQQIQN